MIKYKSRFEYFMVSFLLCKSKSPLSLQKLQKLTKRFYVIASLTCQITSVEVNVKITLVLSASYFYTTRTFMSKFLLI